MLFPKPCWPDLHRCTLVFVLLSTSARFQVHAIRCFFCDNNSGHEEDKLDNIYPNNAHQSACRKYADTSELSPFSINCPPEYNACQASVGYFDKPSESHAYRSCYKIGPGEDMSTTCRNHTYVPGQYSCPCFWDNCNYYVEVTKDTKGNPVGQQDLKPPIKDSPGYAANDPAKKTPVSPNAGGGGGGDGTTTDAGSKAASGIGNANDTSSACHPRTAAWGFWPLLSLIYILCRRADTIGL